jgi:hypothetical protein
VKVDGTFEMYFPTTRDVKKHPTGLALMMKPSVVVDSPFSIANGGKNGVMREDPTMVRPLHACRMTKIVVRFIFSNL